MKVPRVLIASGSSGSGKTLITCGILQALVNREMKVTSFKCGPDYIDPMFHSTVIQTQSRNLDSFFAEPETLKNLLAINGSQSEISVLEGVMGYYDGIAGTHTEASTYEIAKITETPVILVVNCKGMSLSAVAFIQGYLNYKKDSNIQGVILNQLSPMLYENMKQTIEEETSVKVFGYVPKVQDCLLESRHLGLVMPEEIQGIREKLNKLGTLLETTLDLDGILALANKAPELEAAGKLNKARMNDEIDEVIEEKIEAKKEAKIEEVNMQQELIRIGVAKDEAFCFFYEDNLQLLKTLGAEIIEFSPIHDEKLPENIHGLILNGGYPELYASQLSQNQSMKESIYNAIESGIPCIAECGGFMYLHKWMENKEGNVFPMIGTLDGRAYFTGKLSRFGYITLTSGKAFGVEVGEMKAHEFHYFDSTVCGDHFLAQKPFSNRSWKCIHSTDTLFAGFPHHYFYGNPKLAKAFLEKCSKLKKERKE